MGVGLTPHDAIVETLEGVGEGLERLQLHVASAHMGAIERALLLNALDDALWRIEEMKAGRELSRTELLEVLGEALALEARIQQAITPAQEKAQA